MLNLQGRTGSEEGEFQSQHNRLSQWKWYKSKSLDLLWAEIMEFSPCLPSPALGLWRCHTFSKIPSSRADKQRESVLEWGSCRLQPVMASQVSVGSPSLSLSQSHLVCVPAVTLTLADVPTRPFLFSSRKDSPSLECDSFQFICVQFFCVCVLCFGF